MSIYVLVEARQNNPKSRIGDVIAWKETPFTGALEKLPNYVVMDVYDATVEDAHRYLNPVKHLFSYNILAQNENGKRIVVTIDARIVQVYGDLAGMRSEMREYFEDEYGAVFVPLESNPPYYYTMDFPFDYNPNNPTLDVQILKGEFEDRAVTVIDKNRYYLSEADVQAAIDAGGSYSLNRLQAHARLLDKLEG